MEKARENRRQHIQRGVVCFQGVIIQNLKIFGIMVVEESAFVIGGVEIMGLKIF